MSKSLSDFPTPFVFTPEMTDFFTEISQDEALQKILYNSNTILDVAKEAKSRGFDVPAADILKAQAGRSLAIIHEGSDDIKRLVSGEKPLTGAQWGRDGGGSYLDSAGFWFIELIPSEIITDKSAEILPIINALNEDKILSEAVKQAKTFNDLANTLNTNGYPISAVTLLTHQAQTILALDRETTEKMASR